MHVRCHHSKTEMILMRIYLFR